MINKKFKKLFIVFAAIAFLVICLGVLAACDTQIEVQSGSSTLSIVFNLNDGTDTTVKRTINPKKIEYAPQREGYDFEKWTLDPEGTLEISVEAMKNGTVLYAQWSVKTYSVKFFDDQLNLISTQKVNHADAAIAPDADELESYIPQGKVFGGWDKKFDNVTQNLEVYIVLIDALRICTVYFMDNGQILSSSENGQEGQAIPVPTYPQDENGLHFEGYSTQDGRRYREGDLFSTDDVYYAQWSIQVPTAPTIVASNAVYGSDIEFSLENNVTYASLTYSYEWYDAQANKVGEGETYTIATPAVAEYGVYIKVIASRQGFESNYVISQVMSVEVKKATLIATMQNNTITYGDDAPSIYGMSFDGFVLNDDQSVVDWSDVVFNVEYTKGTDIGDYVVQATGFAADNYTIIGRGMDDAIVATLTVNKKDVSVSREMYSTAYTGARIERKFSSNVQEDLLVVDGLLEGHVLTLSVKSNGSIVGDYVYGNNATAAVNINDGGESFKSYNYNVNIVEAGIQIIRAEVSFTKPEATFTFNNTARFDGIQCITAGCTIEYSTDEENYNENLSTSFIDVGTYKVYAKISCANTNYIDCTYTSYDIVINKAELNICALEQVTTYGDESFTLNQSQYRFGAGESTYGINLNIALATNYIVGNPADDAAYKISVSYDANDNFSINSITGNLVVNRAILTANIANASVTYGEAFEPTIAMVNLSGLCAGDDARLTMSTTYDMDKANVGVNEYISCSSANTNYILSVSRGILTITQRALSLRIGNAGVYYGNEFDASAVTYELMSDTSLYGVDAISCQYETDYIVGDGANQSKIISAVVNITRGQDVVLGNYAITYELGTLTVEVRPVKIRAKDIAVIYGNAIAANQYGYDILEGTFYNGVAPSATYSTTYSAGSTTSTSVSVAMSNPNYDVTFINGNVSIEKREITIMHTMIAVQNGEVATFDIRAANALNVYATDTLSGVLATASCEENNYVTSGIELGKSFIWTTEFDIKNANDVSVKEFYTVSYDLNVTIAVAIISHSVTPYRSQYDGSEHSGHITVIDVELYSISYSSDNVNFGLATPPTFVDVGEYTVYYKIEAEGKTTTTGEYKDIITKRNAIIGVNAQVIAYGDAFVANEAMITTQEVCDKDRDSFAITLDCAYSCGDSVGQYDITVKYTANDNYIITVVNNKLSVEKKALNISVGNDGVVYGDVYNPSQELVSIVGLYGSDDARLVISTDYTQGDVIGSYTISATSSNTNYYVASSTNGILTVSPRAVIVRADDKEIEYGDDAPELTYTVQNVYGGYVVQNVILTTIYMQGDIVGTYTIVAGSIDESNANYSFSLVDGALSVKPRVVTIRAEDKDVVYGDGVPTLTYTTANVYDGYVVQNVVVTTAYAQGGDVGAYSIVASVADNNTNYSFSPVEGTLRVTPKQIDVTVANVTATYSQAADLTGAKIENISDEGARSYASFGTSYTVGDDVGVYAITASIIGSNNYVIRSVVGNVVVEALAVDIYVGDASTMYGQELNLNSVGIYCGISDALGYIAPTTDYVCGNNAGTYAISAIATGNYKAGTIKTGVLTVNPAIATITGTTVQEFDYQSGQTFVFDVSGLVASNDYGISLAGSYTYFAVQAAGTFGSDVVFASADGNYTGSVKCYIKAKSVDVGGTLYTIEDALYNAMSGKTIRLTVSTSFANSNDSCYDNNAYYTVKKGVTMLLPYSASDTKGWVGSGSEKSDNYKAHPDKNGDATLYINLSVPANVNLTVNGELIVGALTGSKEAGTNQNIISGGYSQITLNGTVTLNEATLRVIGYIVGNGKIVSNSSTVIENMCLTGWPGGSEGIARYAGTTNATSYLVSGDITISNPKMFPFSYYNLRSIQVENTLNYGSTLQVYTKIATTAMATVIDAQINDAYMTIVSSKSNADSGIIRMSSGAKVVKGFANGRVKLDLYGTCNDGYTAFNMKVINKTATVATNNVIFPINGLTDITLKSGATFTQSYSFKMMQGAKLIVEAGAVYTLNSGAKMIVYTKCGDDGNIWVDPCINAKYPSERGDAILTVNGTMNVNGSFGGVIYSTGAGKVVFGSGCTIVGVTSCEGSGTRDGLKFTFNETDVTKDAALNGYSGTLAKGKTYNHSGSTWA